MTNQSLKDAALDFLGLVASGRIREAYECHVGPGFRHHNPYFRGDATALMEGMLESAAMNPQMVLEVQRAIQEGDQVAVHSRVKQSPQDPGSAVVHLFRFENQRIAELWDVGQAVLPESINENGMF